jgi:Putative zinc-finger
MTFSPATSSAPSTALTAERSCDEIEALLPLVADGALTHDEDPGVFAHLGHCERCQASLAIHDRISLDLPRTMASAPTTAIRFPRQRWIPLAMAAGLMAAVALLLIPSRGDTPMREVAMTASPRVIPPVPPAQTAVAPVTAAAPVVAATPIIAEAAIAAEPVDVEVIALPGRSGAIRYLIKRGEQVTLVEAPARAAHTPTDAVPASYTY